MTNDNFYLTGMFSSVLSLRGCEHVCITFGTLG